MFTNVDPVIQPALSCLSFKDLYLYVLYDSLHFIRNNKRQALNSYNIYSFKQMLNLILIVVPIATQLRPCP